eukprot:4009128-Pyramimonas_sp.AAC.1
MVLPNRQIPRPVLVKQLHYFQAKVDNALCEERVKGCRAATATHGNVQAAWDDARTLLAKYEPDGTRRRESRQPVEEVTMTDFDDWPLS